MFSEMWYGVFMWAAVSSLVFHLPAVLLSITTLRQHKIARFMPIAILLMGIVGPVCGGVLTSKSQIYTNNYFGNICCLNIASFTTLKLIVKLLNISVLSSYFFKVQP